MQGITSTTGGLRQKRQDRANFIISLFEVQKHVIFRKNNRILTRNSLLSDSACQDKTLLCFSAELKTSTHSLHNI